MGKPANFVVVKVSWGPPADTSYVIIRDVGPWEEHLTVTNDADGVVKRLTEQYGGRVGFCDKIRRFAYYDSEGQLDELVHDGNGQFLDFKHGFDV